VVELEAVHKQGFIKNLLLTGQLTRLIVYVCTIVSVVVFLVLALLAFLDILQNVGTHVDFIVFAVLSGTGIYGMYEYMHWRKIYKIDSIFPDFVRDLAESRRAGMTFTRAIMFASKGNYGILSPEIQKIAQQVSWGSSIEEALRAFASRVNTPSIRRTVSLIIEASRGGGNVADVLTIASKDAREIKLLEAERRANMASYVIVIYVGMMVFLAIIVILTYSFIPAMLGGGNEGLAGASIEKEDLVPAFYYASLVQGVGSGLVAGVFEDGKFASGIKHIFVIVLISWIIFKFIVQGV
jgi:flagellar protein FlaJ